LLTFNLGGFLPYSFPFFRMAEFTLVFRIMLVSEFRRPLALTVRLTANVLVGHMLMSAVYYIVTFISK
uniref:ATP synthase subunit a n=1 Tax=Strongyloides papillosus TaxID=174720 RepID=A0A0N5BTN6_STREA